MIWALATARRQRFLMSSFNWSPAGPVICGWEGRGEGLGSGLVLWLLFELGLGGNERYVMRVPGETERSKKRKAWRSEILQGSFDQFAKEKLGHKVRTVPNL